MQVITYIPLHPAYLFIHAGYYISTCIPAYLSIRAGYYISMCAGAGYHLSMCVYLAIALLSCYHPALLLSPCSPAITLLSCYHPALHVSRETFPSISLHTYFIHAGYYYPCACYYII
jgi:hypothetical protein